MARQTPSSKTVETIRHTEDRRPNIPTVEHQAVLADEEQAPRTVRYPRNTDLDPQLMWRGKDEQNWTDLVVNAPPVYIQEKIHPKALIDDLLRQSESPSVQTQLDLFSDFNGIPEGVERTEFYQHDQNWTNRMILGDSLQVMASLAEREGLRGKVQCIYLDPPYGIKFNSNFQWSTTSRDVKDGDVKHITREPEQVKAFRDTWRDGIHSYLTYLRDRLTVARELLTDSGSIFIQIGNENVHVVRLLLDELFGSENFVSQIQYKTTTGKASAVLDSTSDFILWYSKSLGTVKFRKLWFERKSHLDQNYRMTFDESGEVLGGTSDQGRLCRMNPMTSQSASITTVFSQQYYGKAFVPGRGGWKTNQSGMLRILKSRRLTYSGNTLGFVRPFEDFPYQSHTDTWDDTRQSGFGDSKIYVVQTAINVIQRCILIASDAGDLILDPTCGSGTTAYVAEQWGRRWITIDTSRVALALARARLMGARYPYYLLADSPEGQKKEAELAGRPWQSRPAFGNIRNGFVYERVPHITLKSIANTAEIDVIWETLQPAVLAALDALNAAMRGHATPFRVTTGGREGKPVRFDAPDDATFTMPSGEIVPAFAMVEWEVPRTRPSDWPSHTEALLADFWAARIARQKAMDASIQAKAEYEYLYDRPYDDKKRVRVAGPFTVESLSPHRVLGVDENDELIDPFQVKEPQAGYGQPPSFEQIIMENLKTAGVQQARRADRITFTSLTPWPGRLVCGEGIYRQRAGESAPTDPNSQDGATGADTETFVEKRAGIFIGPEFGTVSRPDLVEAAREAADAGFDVLIACAFNYEAHTTEFTRLGKVPVLKARMNADLHMADDLKNTGKGNLFVVFGEPDIDLIPEPDGTYRVQLRGVDLFNPATGEVLSCEPTAPEGRQIKPEELKNYIACWFIDTDYNEESFFVRHAYFLGVNDPYSALKTTLKAEINADAWATLNSDLSRPFPKPKSGRIAVKVINYLGDEVMKVFRVR